MKLFTQNIDCLEREAGVPDEKIVEAHGSFARQRCIECGTPYPDGTCSKSFYYLRGCLRIPPSHRSLWLQSYLSKFNIYAGAEILTPSTDLMKSSISKREVPHCLTPECNGLVKPDIVFFGEALPEDFHKNRMLPSTADLCIVMGTSLMVQPFASLPSFCTEGTYPKTPVASFILFLECKACFEDSYLTTISYSSMPAQD